MIRLKKRVLYPLLLLGLLATAGFVWGSIYFSRAQVLERYLTVRQQSGELAERVKPYVVWADTTDYLSLEELSWAKFPQLTPEQAEALRDDILSNQPGDDLYMTNIGSKFWIFPDYRLAMKPLTLTLKTNIKGAQLTLNDRQVGVSDSDNYQVSVDRLPQSDYRAGLKGTYQERPLDLTKSYEPGHPVLDLSFQFKTFSISSNLLDGQVYSDEQKIGQLVDGGASFEDLAVTPGAQVYVKKTFPDGDLVSDKVSLDQVVDGQDLDLSVQGLMSEDEATAKLLAAFDQLAVYYSNGHQDGAALSSLFDGGDKNEFYGLLKASIATKTQNDARLATSFAIPSLYVTDVQQIGKTSYRVTFGGQYDYYYDKATDPKHKSQGHIYQAISGGFTLEKKGEAYLIATKGGVLDLDAEDNQIKLPPSLKTVTGLPSGLAGTWEMRRDDLGAKVYLSFQPSGVLTTTLVYDDKTRQEFRLNIASHQPITSGLHALKDLSGQPEALVLDQALPGVIGLHLLDNQLLIVGWGLAEGASFDPEAPYQELYRLTKSAGLPRPSSSSSGQSSSSSPSSTSSSSASSSSSSTSSETVTEGSEGSASAEGQPLPAGDQ